MLLFYAILKKLRGLVYPPPNMKLYPSLQTYTVADNPHGWKFLSDMVDLFHVSIFFSDWSFCCTFSVLLFGPSSHHILDFAKTLEGKAPFKYSGEAEHLAVRAKCLQLPHIISSVSYYI